MGKCKFSDAMKEKYPWATKMDDAHSCKCRYDGKVISVLNGAAKLSQHETTALHRKASSSTLSQPSIASALNSQMTVQDGTSKALLIHCLKLAMDNASFRTSDSSTRSRNMYGQMFPDSKYTSLNY